MNSSIQSIGSLDTASPDLNIKQGEVKKFLLKRYADKLSSRTKIALEKVFKHPGVKQRYFAFSDPDCLADEGPDNRIDRFTAQALKLSREACEKALNKSKVKKGEIGAIVVNTCTGYICPGLSTYLIEALGLSRTIKAFDLVGSGCGGAIPNLQICQSLLKESSIQKVLSVSVEICSATFQMEDNLSLIISNALFGDGAAAAVIWNKPYGLSLIDSVSSYAPEYREDIRFIYKNGQLHNQLSRRLPMLAAKAAKQVVMELLLKQGIRNDEICHWVIHPGGENVIASVQAELGLSDDKVLPSRRVLESFGNLSSAAVWFILKQVYPMIKKDDLIVMLAFGAGLSAHAFLLKSLQVNC